MRARRFTALTAALIAAASLTGGTVAHAQSVVRPSTFTADAQGVGPTLAAAQQAATAQLYADYYGCTPPVYLVEDYQLPDGTWWADVAADCEGDI